MPRRKVRKKETVGRPAMDWWMDVIHIAAVAKAFGQSIDKTCDKRILRRIEPSDGSIYIMRKTKPSSLKRRYYEFRKRFLQRHPLSEAYLKANPGSFGPYVDGIIAEQAEMLRGALKGSITAQ